ncbi:COG2426 family protein [Halalkalibacter alkalisediminis]|uniref:COG2426 family protein n=1 Tax=Halalkalibacter alkalisediminis TaxID=935616 RepID=A0ABV6NM64_9BACI|nr:small multi-drug export protein [Halalkalibacter alkalisediminis]
MEDIKDSIQGFLIENLSFLPPEAIILIISAMPIIEIRGGLPSGVFLGLSFQSALFFSILGNLLPIAPILVFFKPVSKFLMRFNSYEKFYGWIYKRTMGKSHKVEKYGAMGLVLFTAIPFPTTGAYSACLAAILFFIPFRIAFFSISIGVLIASIIMGIITYPLYLN